ncbi:unnamed protein product, partial [Brassica oleracea var. botrytis]
TIILLRRLDVGSNSRVSIHLLPQTLILISFTFVFLKASLIQSYTIYINCQWKSQYKKVTIPILKIILPTYSNIYISCY